jgi:hypothetical protein
MSRTYKTSRNRLRNPRGQKQALIQGARKRAVPPDWDDKPLDKQCRVHYKVAVQLLKAGEAKDEVINKIRHRSGLTQRESRDIVLSAMGRIRYQAQSVKRDGKAWYDKHKAKEATARAAEKKVADNLMRYIQGGRLITDRLRHWAIERGVYVRTCRNERDRIVWTIVGSDGKPIYQVED